MNLYPLEFSSKNSIYTGSIPALYFDECDKEIVNNKIKAAVYFIEKTDLEWSRTAEFYKERNVKTFHYPIKDMCVPKMDEALTIIKTIMKEVKQGNVYVHCVEGKGRTGMIMACLTSLKKHLNGPDATKFTRGTIPGAIESKIQESFVNDFAKTYAKVKKKPAEEVKKPVEGIKKPVVWIKKPVEVIKKPIKEECKHDPADKLAAKK